MRHVLILVGLLMGCQAASGAPTQQERQAPMELGNLYDFNLEKLDGTPFAGQDLSGKVVLFVNVASKCGYTRQYAGLQSVYEKYKDDGLVIVGVPCNQFGGQEPGSPEEIAKFCKMNYGVTFPLLAKQDVNGKDRSGLYNWLVNSSAGAGKNIRWNFEKFLVGRDGAVLQHFGSSTAPDDAALNQAIQAALAVPNG